MIYIFLSIICSVFVGVLFKIARKASLSKFQIIAWNYLFAILSLVIVYHPKIRTDLHINTLFIIGSLVMLLPVVFIFQANAIKYSGIVKTDIAQRLSLFISICFSIFISKELFNSIKIISLLFAFTAIFLIFYRKASQEKTSNSFYLLLVLGGFGIIDVLFKKVASIGEVSLMELLLLVFLGAFVVASTLSIYQIKTHKDVFSAQNIVWGAFVGLLNFGNIAFYILAHQTFASQPSTVFVGMNMGVITLGSMIGIFYFKEKMNLINYIGIVISLLAIAMMAYSQLS